MWILLRKLKEESSESKGHEIIQRISKNGLLSKVSAFISLLGSVGGERQINLSSIMTKKTLLSNLHTLESLAGAQRLNQKKNTTVMLQNGKLASLIR